MATKNLKSKTVKASNAYEVYVTADLSWVWYVLKHWQADDKEVANPLARVFCQVHSPMTMGSYDLGDVYLREIKSQAYEAHGLLADMEAIVADQSVPQSIRDRVTTKVDRLKVIIAGRY